MAGGTLARSDQNPAKENGSNVCELTTAEQEAGAQRVYRIVRFDGPVLQQWQDALSKFAEVFDYVPQFAYVVRVPAKQVGALCNMPHVRGVGKIDPTTKLGKLGALGAESNDAAVKLRVTLFPGESPAPVSLRIKALEGSVNNVTESAWGASLSVLLPADKAVELAEMPAVRRIEPVPVFKAN